MDIVAKTHSACQNFGHGCVTADHYVLKYIRHGSSSADYLFIEELTQIDCRLWCDLVKPQL